ncbi:MAG: hypothetical protein WC869_05520 [Phycisphaerae bacterium]
MNSRKGSILIAVLFVMFVLSVTAISFAYRATVERREASQDAARAKLRATAQSAVAIALDALTDNTNDFDHPAEEWHTHASLASLDYLPEWKADAAGRPAQIVSDYQVIDEESKLNVLYASSESLVRLGMTESQIACLFDWMDGDDIARSDGAEKDYYQRLPQPYRCKNAPLEVLDELLLIRGFDRQSYRGDESSLASDSNASHGQAASAGWARLLTCVGDGRINLNTAPEAVLRTLPISENAVGQIVGYRRFDSGSGGSLEEHVFRSIQDVQQLQGLSDAERDVLGQVSAFRSQYFRIFVKSRQSPTGLAYRLEVLVQATPSGRLKVLQWIAGAGA